MKPTEVFETYWRFAAERQALYFNRLRDPEGPWTSDPILQAYRFTNAYRAADRVSQYLIRHVQYNDQRSAAPEDVFFRTMLFKIFNRIETWEALEQSHGPIEFERVDFNLLSGTLEELMRRGQPVYSAAYIMPSPNFGHSRKHDNHLALLSKMMEDRLPRRLMQKPSLSEVYASLLEYPSLGRFLAFQFTIDLNYSALIDFPEASFIVAGPGAIDGISKCFNSPTMAPEDIIMDVYETQAKAFADYGIQFQSLFGRPLMPIDCQNLFCEISKYARVAHPERAGVSGRTRIKQGYSRTAAALPTPFFPPKWNLNDEVADICGITKALATHDEPLLRAS
ncbi:nucleotide kinase domain-containing protein [Hyphomonas sp.]|uniref:nucleotide kinase domain-containing protein n=1 Tax=Hyphomonas sp. TaxID=87 RepID=UPI0025BA36DF|nr:nucleotide kinase domain-containing protein [Hyphomonas sp.]